ncbi:hypothetical protein CERZMDRAFT_106532 [Cercospora zeae-maydis SCOH1-5]|uniref:Aquaporin-like protein n=1 Tax=Cercospora zeae-maydis SCOH1-5 TaxID=717836 RepID=A0A6A6FD45_9PEZI|nr:hypothetical protein CERZMDRAFT_106532 [Cercospora zeae-maydis SCOH1-5]
MAQIERLHTHDLELGATEVLQKHFARHVVATRPVSQRKLDFEHARPRWLRECVAEATGAFFYVLPGIAAIAAFTVSKANAGFGSIFAIGLAFAFGIAFAVIVCAPVSGGHFSPALTICYAIFQGFPLKKVPHYIFSQVFGGFMAALFLMGMYHVQLHEYEDTLRKAGVHSMVFNGGPASVLCSFPNLIQTNLGYLVLIEFFASFYVGLIIWAVLDPANPFVTPSAAPFMVGLAYATIVWGFGGVTLGLNTARDLGPRIVAAIFYGKEAFTYYHYSWIPLLINIPSTICAVCFYEAFFRDSLQKIGKGAAVHENGEEGLALHLTKTGISTHGDRALVEGMGEKMA